MQENGENSMVMVNKTEKTKEKMWKYVKFEVAQYHNPFLRFGLRSIVIRCEPKASSSKTKTPMEQFLNASEQKKGKHSKKKNKGKPILNGVTFTTSGFGVSDSLF